MEEGAPRRKEDEQAMESRPCAAGGVEAQHGAGNGDERRQLQELLTRALLRQTPSEAKGRGEEDELARLLRQYLNHLEGDAQGQEKKTHEKKRANKKDQESESDDSTKKKNESDDEDEDDEVVEEEDEEEEHEEDAAKPTTTPRPTVVVVEKKEQEPLQPLSQSDPPCFADDPGEPEFEIENEEEDEEEVLTSQDEDDASRSSVDKANEGEEDDILVAEEDVEKEAEDRLHERFLDYDKIWEHSMATPQGLLGQVRKGFIKPALVEVSNGSLLHARLSFKGGGQLHHEEGIRLSAKEVLAAGPVRTRVLFGTQEGWPFQVPLKKGHKKKVYNMAADSQDEAQVWLHTVLEAPKDSTKSVRGFLWVQSAQTGKWARYYCIADPSHFEWFRTKELKSYDLKSLLAKNMKLTGSIIAGESYNESSPISTMKNTPKVSKKALRSYHMRELKNYKHELILWTKEKPIKKVFHFMTESNDRRLFWKNLLLTSATSNAQPKSADNNHLTPPSGQSSSPTSSKPGSRPSSRPSSAYNPSAGPIILSDSASSSASSSASPSVPESSPHHNSSSAGVTFSGLHSSNPFQPSPASAYMAIRFSSLSEHMAYALKGVGEEEKKAEKKRKKEKHRNGASKEDSEPDSPGVPQAQGTTPESRPRFNTLNKDLSIFRSGVGHETKETTQLRNELRDLMERADREAGKTPFGNYSLSKSGVGDGHVRVISLDGGGLRAIMEAVILERLVEVFPDLLERTDMFAGISGGSMLAAGLVCGRSPAFIKKLLEVLAPRVFVPKGRFRTGKAIQSSKFRNRNLLVAGSEVTKNINLDELKPKMLLIPSFLLDNGLENDERSWEPLIYHNVPLKTRQHNKTAAPVNRSHTLSRELDPLRLQSSGKLRSHKRASSIDERNKERSGTAPETMLRDLHKEKEKEKERKKERKRGSSEHFANRAYTLRPPTQSSSASAGQLSIDKNHKRTRSSADDLARVVVKERVKESLLVRPESGLANSNNKLKTHRKEKEEHPKAAEPETPDDSDEEDDDDVFCMDEERHVPIWDCVMGSSAAPTYFPSYKRQIDAAVMCNNPSLAAISVLMSERALHPKSPKQIHMLSLGTGRLSQFIDGESHDWGMIKWAPWLLQIMIGATSLYEQKQAKAILGPRYHRVDPFLPMPLAMDDPLLLGVLVEQAMKVDLEETIEWIEENWYSEEERRERRAKREQQRQEEEEAANEKPSSQEGEEEEGKSKKVHRHHHHDAARKKRKKRKQDKDRRKSVYAPVGKAGEEPTLRGTWGDAAWFGTLDTGTTS